MVRTTAPPVVAACSRPLSHCSEWSQRLMPPTAAISCCLGDSPAAVPNCVSWRLADNRSLPCDDPPFLSRYGSKRVPSGALDDGEHNAVLRGPRRCSKERQHRGRRALGASLALSSCATLESSNTTGTFLVLLVNGPRSIGVIRAQSGCFEGRRWLLEGAKLSSLPTSSSCDKDGWHNLHNCTAHQSTRHRD